MQASALSLAARELRDYLTNAYDAAESKEVVIGHPNAAFKLSETPTAGHVLNLFFYHLEHGGYPADGQSADPFYIRMYCLITAFSRDTTTGNNVSVGAGENDLRVIGGVIGLLHQRPTVNVQTNNGELAQLQAVLAPINLDDINHIWATQGETPYRLSVAYELALAPAPLGVAVARTPRVGGLGLGLRTEDGIGRGEFVALTPQPAARRVDTAAVDWAPLISFVDTQGELRQVLAIAADEIPSHLGLVLAGHPGVMVDIQLELWTSADGWVATALDPVVSAALPRDTLDASAAPELIALPAGFASAGQALIYAVRRFTRPDGNTVSVRSNPLLVIILPVTSP